MLFSSTSSKMKTMPCLGCFLILQQHFVDYYIFLSLHHLLFDVDMTLFLTNLISCLFFLSFEFIILTMSTDLCS